MADPEGLMDLLPGDAAANVLDKMVHKDFFNKFADDFDEKDLN